MASGLRELIALSLLAGLGCGLALAHGDRGEATPGMDNAPSFLQF
jgi:hypothetical protein